MSKQSEAEQAQGYELKPVNHVCLNCKFCNSKFVVKYDTWGAAYPKEKDMLCGIGGFAVKEMGTCKLYERKD